MTIASLLVFLLIGLIVGVLASWIMRGGSLGVLGNVVIGMAGAVVSGALFTITRLNAIGFMPSVIATIVLAIVSIQLVRFMAHRRMQLR